VSSLSEVVWINLYASHGERFADLLKQKSLAHKFFNDEYAQAVSLRIGQAHIFGLKLSIVSLVILFSIYGSLIGKLDEIELFGVALKGFPKIRELLLVTFTLIQIASSVSSIQAAYLQALLDAWLTVQSEDGVVRKFYGAKFKPISFDQVLDLKFTLSSTKQHHGMVLIFILIWFLVLVLLAFSFAIAIGYVQVFVVYALATQPSSNPMLQQFSVIFATGGILLTWLGLLFSIPLPAIEYKNVYQLSELKRTAPVEYQKTLDNIAKSRAKNELWSLGRASLLLSVMTIMGYAVFVNPMILQRFDLFAFGAAIVAFSSLAVVLIGGPKLRSLAMRYHFKKIDETKRNRDTFRKTLNVVLAMQICLSLFTNLALLYVVFSIPFIK
jgi:hypothetical protein